jgi:threonine/homoserine efflux transporter RhtA
MTRHQLISYLPIAATVIGVSALTGFLQTGAWAQLATVVIAGVLASFAAPEYFGWRYPPDG